MASFALFKASLQQKSLASLNIGLRLGHHHHHHRQPISRFLPDPQHRHDKHSRSIQSSQYTSKTAKSVMKKLGLMMNTRRCITTCNHARSFRQIHLNMVKYHASNSSEKNSNRIAFSTWRTLCEAVKQQQQQQQHDRTASSSQENVGLFNRVKDLSRRYGGAAFAVYLFVSVIDFSLCFLLVYTIGADHVYEAENWVLEQLHWRRKTELEQKQEQQAELYQNELKQKKDQGTLWTTAVLAYAIHKTILLPLRVGVTAWTTPKLVRTLRAWGWNVGRPATTATTTTTMQRLTTPVHSTGTKVKTKES